MKHDEDQVRKNRDYVTRTIRRHYDLRESEKLVVDFSYNDAFEGTWNIPSRNLHGILTSGGIFSGIHQTIV